jgi:uncharacterized damage-inducible protein DinB
MGYDEPADLIGSCEASLDTLGLLMGDIKEEVQETGDSWTIAQILNHLLETEQRFVGRVRRLRGERHPRMKVLPQGDYNKLSALKAWTRFYRLRLEHIRLLRRLKTDEWRRSGTLDPVGRVTIYSVVRHMAAHDAMHTAQIARRLSGRAR